MGAQARGRRSVHGRLERACHELAGHRSAPLANARLLLQAADQTWRAGLYYFKSGVHLSWVSVGSWAQQAVHFLQGYYDAASTFQTESGTAPGMSLETCTERMHIRNAVEAGNIEDAVERVNDLNPEVQLHARVAAPQCPLAFLHFRLPSSSGSAGAWHSLA